MTDKTHHKSSCFLVKPKLVHRTRCSGLSLIEMMLALTITALILTATAVALDASFRAYAAAAEEAGTQAQTRMVVQRLLTLIRTSTAHGPVATSRLNNPRQSDYITLMDPKSKIWTIGYDSDTKQLWLVEGDDASDKDNRHPLLSGVTDALFTTHSRQNNAGLWVLDRATIDITVTPSQDESLGIEKGAGAAIHIVASTMPRKLD